MHSAIAATAFTMAKKRAAVDRISFLKICGHSYSRNDSLPEELASRIFYVPPTSAEALDSVAAVLESLSGPLYCANISMQTPEAE